ncbi:transmembrane protein 256 homolog [Parasteatoda tepidariorum]|nr:transmembrane protein 256 homolog [Parasteatoda tepidariorum]
MIPSKAWDYANPLNWLNMIHGSVIPKHGIKTHAISTPHVCALNLSKVAGSMFVKLAGVSGAIAVAMGAYGSHGLFPKPDVPAELKDVYKTANFYHFIHSLALMGVPLTRKPLLVGTLLTTGMFIFCGSCYYYALTGNTTVIRVTPYGGSLLIVSWLAMLL